MPQLPPCRDLTVHQSQSDESPKVLIEHAYVGKQRTHKRGRRRPRLQAYGVNKSRCVATARNVRYNGWRGRPGGEEGHERGDDPEDERNERMSGPEERCERCYGRERDQRQVDPSVSRPERRIGRQQCVEHVGSEELAHSECTICSTG